MTAAALPNFAVIGGARCGSTSLYHYLRPHPEVFLPRRKELHFFDYDFERGLDWYRRYFSGVDGEVAIGDVTPNYMYYPPSIERMASVIPDARLVAILRNPVDRAHSHYWMNRRQGKERLSFPEALNAEEERLATGDRTATRFAYVDRGRYLVQLERVCRHYPRERLLVLLFDDLRADPVGTYRRLCAFLGVDGTVVPDTVGGTFNAPPEFRSLAARRMTLRLKNRRLGILARALGRLNERRVPYPAMEPAIRRRLVERFEPEIRALCVWLDRDVSGWLDS